MNDTQPLGFEYISQAEFMEKHMTQKIAVVTGSYKGLGLEIARQLAQRGLQVIVTARKVEAAQQAAVTLAGSGLSVEAPPAALDVADSASVAAFAAWVTERHGRVDVLVNNAGVNPKLAAEEQSVLTALPEVFLKTVDTNAVGALRMAQALVPLMRKNGYGRIVNVSTEMAALSSIAGDHYPIAPSYRASKVALNMVSQLLAKELAGSNILVNSYSPGWTKTDMGGPHAPYTAEEAAQTAVFLATLPDGGTTGGFYAEMRKLGGPVVVAW